MKNMNGMIDPYTLGFILSLLGATITYSAHQDDEPTPQTQNDYEQTIPDTE